MNEPNSPVHDDELHAFVDGELPADRREAVTAWLAENPEQAAMTAAAAKVHHGRSEPPPSRISASRLKRAGTGSSATAP